MPADEDRPVRSAGPAAGQAIGERREDGSQHGLPGVRDSMRSGGPAERARELVARSQRLPGRAPPQGAHAGVGPPAGLEGLERLDDVEHVGGRMVLGVLARRKRYEGRPILEDGRGEREPARMTDGARLDEQAREPGVGW